MGLPIKPETLPRKAVELLEFIEWMQRKKITFYHAPRSWPINDSDLRELVKEYTGVKSNG